MTEERKWRERAGLPKENYIFSAESRTNANISAGDDN